MGGIGALISLAGSLVGCGADVAGVLLPANEEAGLEPGEAGPYGAVWTDINDTSPGSFRLNGGLVLPEAVETGLPPVVIVHGGFVEASRYRWLAAHLASRGFAVVLPEYPLNLAFFGQEETRRAMDWLKERPEVDPQAPTVVIGHSLGGVVAGAQWLEHPDDYDLLVVLASYLAGGDDPTARGGDPALVITGSTDALSTVEEVTAGFDRFTTAALGVVEGMNHYAWCDDNSDKDLEGDGPQDRPVADTRRDGLVLLDTTLALLLQGDPDPIATLSTLEPAAWPSTLEVTLRF